MPTYELLFAMSGRSYPFWKWPDYKREHATLESAQAAARKVYASMNEHGINRAMHTAVIFDDEGRQYTA
jgi:hypothetical protein